MKKLTTLAQDIDSGDELRRQDQKSRYREVEHGFGRSL